MKTFLTTGRMPLPEELGDRGKVSDFVNFGDDTIIAVRRWGFGGLGIEWRRMRFGLRIHSGTTVSYTRVENAAYNHGWHEIATRLAAVPIYGYRWRSRDEWTKLQPGWALGFFDPDSGFILAAADLKDGLGPVVSQWAETRAWLRAEAWDQMRLLRTAAEGLNA